MEKKKLTYWDLIKIGFRSFLIGAAWNIEGMQNIGFCYTLLPGLKKIASSQKDLKDRIKRHLEIINTQPYISSLLIGVILNLEEKNTESKKISLVKQMLMGCLAAIGDQFFWGGIKPLFIILSLSLLLWLGIWGFLITFFLYILLIIYFRIKSIIVGYKYGEDILPTLMKYMETEKVSWFKYITVMILSLFITEWFSFIELSKRYSHINSNYIFLFSIIISVTVGYLSIKFRKGPLLPLLVIILGYLLGIIVKV